MTDPLDTLARIQLSRRMLPITTANDIDFNIELLDGWYEDMWPPVIGQVTLRLVNRHIYYVCKMELRPSYRHQKLWPAVHEAICAVVKDLGAHHLICTVRHDNPHIQNVERNYDATLADIAGVSRLFIKAV